MQLTGIFVKREKGAKTEQLECCSLKTGKGLSEDYHAGGDVKELTLFDDGLPGELESMEYRGLCMRRLKPSFTVRGLNGGQLKVGDRLSTGTAELEITAKKRCFPECALLKEKAACPLKAGALFAKTVKDGTCRIGDEITKL